MISNLKVVTTALKSGDKTALEPYIEIAKSKGTSFEISNETFTDEDHLMDKYIGSFTLLKKWERNWPIHPCLSCEKLLPLNDLVNVNNLRKSVENSIWKNLLQYVEENNLPKDFICSYCLRIARAGALPPTCGLNNLALPETPAVIAALNDFEKILIQRAKAFQVVTRMGTISGKNKPPSMMNKKVIGRTFHLPIPLEETLKKLPKAEECLMKYQDYFILIRGIPGKQKQIWENLVDLSSVYRALIWLKGNNPLYSKINIPRDASNLLDDLSNYDAQFSVESNNSDEVEENDEEIKSVEAPAMLTMRDPEDEFYQQYTVHPLQDNRKNIDANILYQMLQIQDEPIDNRHQDLDLRCFPSLYCHGINGQNAERPVKLHPSQFVKCRLMSRNSSFRLDIQYLFFLQNACNMRQLAYGIYQKLYTAKGRVTAAEYLKQIEKDDLQGNLRTIFSKLRNSPSFWSKPRSDVNLMARYYGSGVFFFTFSPGEYKWPDLDEYLRILNPVKSRGKSTSSLIAMDPVATSRFVDMKLKAMMKFLTSENGPLGKIAHYAWRREYQARGIQHFHTIRWVENAPIIGEATNEEISRFVCQHISCALPDKNKFPTLHERVMTFLRPP